MLWVLIRRAVTIQAPAQAIATGPVGEAAYEGGIRTAVLGVLLHVMGAFSWTAVFSVMSRARPAPASSPHFYLNLVTHAVMIGLPRLLILGHVANDHQRRHR